MAKNKSEKIIIQVQVKDSGVSAQLSKVTKDTKKLSDEQRAAIKIQKQLNTEKQREAELNNENYIELQRAKIANANLAKEQMNLALQTDKTTTATIKGKTQTGLNNAILTEAGRTASDAAYGMQGMANNLGQLLTLMGQHVETKGGFSASMKSLGKSLWGVGGVLIGMQLLISFLPRLEKMFKKLRMSADDFTKSLTTQGEVTKATLKELDDENTSMERRLELIRSLEQSDSQLYDTLTKTGKTRQEQNDIIKSHIELLENEERIKNKKIVLDEEIKDLEEEINAPREKAENLLRKEQKELAKLIELQDKEYSSDRARDIKNTKKTIEAFRTDLSELNEKEIKETELKIALEKQIIDLEVKNAKIRRGLKEASFVKQLPIDKDGKLKKGEETKDDGSDLSGRRDAMRLNQFLFGQDYGGDIDAQKQFLETQALLEKEAVKLKSEEMLKIAGDDAFQQLMIKQELADKLQAIDDETAKKSIALDQSVADAKVQLAGSALKAIAGTMEKGSKEYKYFAAGSAIIDTYAAINGIFKSAAANPETVLFPAYPYIQAGIMGARGFANVKKILATKPKATSGSASTTTSAPIAPSFNIVGSTGTNQLAEAIGSTTQKPVKAFVVSSEVSTAQQLDRNRVESASI